jgi:hypothetical protein
MSSPATGFIDLFLNHLFDVADHLLNLAGQLFGRPFGLEVGILGGAAHGFFHLPFRSCAVPSILSFVLSFISFSSVVVAAPSGRTIPLNDTSSIKES